MFINICCKFSCTFLLFCCFIFPKEFHLWKSPYFIENIMHWHGGRLILNLLTRWTLTDLVVLYFYSILQCLLGTVKRRVFNSYWTGLYCFQHAMQRFLLPSKFDKLVIPRLFVNSLFKWWPYFIIFTFDLKFLYYFFTFILMSIYSKLKIKKCSIQALFHFRHNPDTQLRKQCN